MTLAIVIPAYKSAYLERTLHSLVEQTNKNFHIFIGNDNSPEEIEGIVRDFESHLPITYFRFAENFGSRSLTRQWSRCIDLAGGFEWIWLFSDDDTMQPDAVDGFYKTMRQYPNHDIYRFHVSIIDHQDRVIKEFSPLPETTSGVDFLVEKWRGKRSSFAVEYIFRASHFRACGGFVDFDLAWNSDDATWFSLSQPRCIRKISASSIHWRSSDINISRSDSRQMCLRKLEANLQMMKYIHTKLPSKFTPNGVKSRVAMGTWFISSLKSYQRIHQNLDTASFIAQASDIIAYPFLKPVLTMYFNRKAEA